MKKTFQRWLAMLLAVLMVMGTLPTSAWAARREEEFAEQPVIGEGDGVTDTLGKHDDGGEYPVDPVDPSDPPADLNTAGFAENITVDSRVTSGVFATATKNSGTDDNFVILIVPKFTLAPNESIETTKYITDGYVYFTGAVNKELNTIKGYLDGSFANMPFYWVRTNNLEIATSLSIAWDGSVYADGKISDTDKVSIENTYGDIKQLQKLSDFWSAGQKFYVPDTATEITGGTLPFEVFFHGTSGMGHGQLDLPISAQPLKVEIETKDAVARTRFRYYADESKTLASDTAWGEQLFTEVTLTNTTDTNMTVTVKIKREAVSPTEPALYGKNTNIEDASGVKLSAMSSMNGYYVAAAIQQNLSYVYGLLGNEDSGTNKKWDGTLSNNGIVSSGTNVQTQSTLTGISVPKNSSTTIYVAGTYSSDDAKAIRNGFDGIKVGNNTGAAHYNFWSSYMITATTTAGPEATGSDTAGIRWVKTPTTRPKVQLVHGTDLIDPTVEANKGTIMDSRDSTNYADAAELKQHRVSVGKIGTAGSQELAWNVAGYYELPANVTVGISKGIYVDGVLTNQVTKADNATVQVPMYAVNVTDNEPHDATRKLGSYMWDATVADIYEVKKVAYNYYPEQADVGVYATKTGFSHWTGVTGSTSLNKPDTTLPLERPSSAATPGQVTGLSADTDVVANYLQQIKLVTTFGGKDLGENSIAKPGDRSIEHVFAITLGSASATVDTTGDWKTNNITVQEGTELAWTITPSAEGKYNLVINGVKVTTVNTANLPKVEGTDYNYVIELAGVIPKVAGTTKAGSTLILPHDQNPARAEGNVTVTGAANNEAGTTVLYYPMDLDSKVTVRGGVAEGDTLSKLNYPSDADKDKIAVGTAKAGENTIWRLELGEDKNTRDMQFTASNTNPLVVTFGAADGTAKVTIFVDADESDAPVNADGEVALYKDGKRVTGLTKGDTGVYSGTAGPETYDIYINGNDTGTDIEITAGAEKEATVQYWTVSVSTDGNGKATVTANTKTALAVDGKTSAEASNATAASIVVIEGTSVTWAFGQANDYYEADKWDGGANHNDITATVGTDTVKSQKALFKKLKATVTIHVKKGDAAANFTDYGQEIKLTTSDKNETTNPVTLTETNDYTFTASLEAGETTYYIWATTNATGSTYKQVSSFTVPNATAIEKDVNYYTLTVAADTSKDSGATAGVAYGETAPGEGTTTSIVALSGGTAMVKAFPSGSNYAWSKWESSDKDTLAAPTTQSAQVTTVDKDITLTAFFTKPKYDTKLNLKLTGDPVAATNADITNIKLTVGANTYTIGTGDGKISYDETNKVWVAHGVTNVAGNNGTWTITTRNGDYTVPGEGDGGTAVEELFVVKTAAQSTYENSQADMTANNTNDLTRAIVEVGTDITNLAVDTKTGYTHSGWTVTGAANSEAVDFDNATFELTKKTTSEVTLTPTFTYIATIVPTVGNTDTVCDVNTVVLTAKDATNTNTTVGTPTKITAEGADKGKWTVTGLTIGTEYAIWVNGHKSDKTVTAIEKVKKVPMWTVSVATTTGGTVALTTTSKLSTTMPNGATYAGWTITATANTANGYRLGDAAGKVWKLTTGDTIGALSGDEIAAPTLSVPNPITGNIIATAYFTQQWTVKSTVDSASVSSTATLTDKDSGDGTKDSPSTKTIDNTKYVKVTFNRSAGETLDGWTLSNGGAGKWYVGTTPDAEGATWTDWATTAPTKAVESFYFKPSADSTITAAVKTKPYPVTITVLKDGEPYTGLDVELREGSNVHQTTESATTGGTYTVEVEAGKTYTVYTNGLAGSGDPEATSVTISFTVEQAEAAIKEDATAEQKAVLTREVKYWTITVETTGHGNASTKDGDRTAATDYTATPAKSSDSHIVENGHTISWGTANPETHYEFKSWQTQQTVDGELKWVDIATAAVPSTATAAHHLRARFGRKIATLIVTFRKNGVQDTYTGDNPYTLTVTSADVTQAGSTSTYTATVDQGVAYSITASRTGYVGGDYTTTFTATKADPDPVYVDYYDVTAKTFVKDGGTAADARGNAKLVWVKADNSTAELGHTDYKNEGGSGATTSFTATVLTGTKVQWQAYNAADNYSFANWDDNTNLTANPYPATAAAITSGPQEHTAYFTKDKYNTYLYLTVNGDAYGTAAADDDNIKSVKLVTAKNGETEVAGVTVEYVEAKTLWAAEGVPEANEPWWRVETVDGGVYYKEASRDDKSSDVAPVIDATGDTTKDKAVVREPLFGVVIERGAGNDTTATYTPTLQAQTGSEAKTRIVTEAEVAATVDLNKKSGYTWSKWLSKKSASPTNTDDLDTTNHGTSTTTTTADGTFALVKGYTAPTTGDDKDLHIKPVYTFTTTIVTKYKTDLTDVTKVEINDGTTTTTVNKETAGTGDHTGRYTASGLDPEKTYTIIVNGFPSTVTFDKDDAGEDVDVTIFKVTVEQEDKKDSTLTPDGKAYVKLGANATGASATSVYLPIGATTTTEATDETKVNLTAAVGDTNPVFRLYNKDNAATDNYDEILWNAAFTAPAGKTMTAAIATNTGTQTPNNLTIGGDDGMQADVTVTAYFLRQYDLTVSAVKEDKTTPATSKVNVTEKQGLGTSDLPANAAQSVTMSKVDEQTYVKVEFQKAVGETFIGWDFTAADGKLYTGVKNGAVDPDTEVAVAAAANNTTTTVYFVPAKDSAALKAVVKAATYNVKVTVKLDNTEYKNEDLKVELRGSDGKTIELFDEKDGNQTGVFTIPESVVTKASPEVTYKIYVNGVDLDATLGDNDYTEIAKDIYFTAKQAEGIKADGNPATTDEEKKELQANLEKTINYYHVNLAVNPANAGAVVNKVGFGSTMPNGSTGTASKIYLAKTVESANNGVQTIDIIAGAYDDNNKTHFRFDKWEQTGPNDGATTPTPITIGEFAHTTTQEQETYKLPNEATLTATNDDGSFKITTGNQLTLTATFVQQYKVKVQLKDSSLGSYAEAKQKKNAAATTYTEIEVNVDKGSSAYIKGTVTGVDYAFAQWSIKADNGKGKFANNETLGGEGVIGYLAEDTFTPEQDSILELELWQAGAISKDGWEYDKADATKSVAGSGELKKMLWTPNNGQTPTEVWVVKTADLTSTNKGTKLTENTHYTVTANADGTTTFEFDEAYLKGLDIASYTATFVYTLGAAGHKINYTGWTKTGAFSIKATKQDLTKVDIQVKDGELPETPDDVIHGSATANVDEEDRNAVRYEDHTVTNVPKADLLYQWYYSDKEIVRKIEGSSGLTVFKDDPAGTANAKTAMEKGEAFLTNATATYGIKKLDGQTADNLSIASNDTLKGKYVFALVWVDDSSDVAQGAVITNAISVDYDATVSVYEDGTDADHLIQEAQKDNYTVYLWDAASTETFPADPAATGSKAIPANYSATDKKYHTEDSNLNAKKTYHVYVQEVEGDKTHYLILGGNTPTTITRTTNTADVYYYTVTTEAVSKETSAKNNIADATAASGAPGETFDATPTFSAKTGNDTAIPSGNGVLQGSHVKANANKLEGKNVGWEQDYDLTWMNKGATGDYTDVTGTNKVQTSTTAVSVGYEHSQNLTGVLTISGRLTQNTYTLTGIIRDVNNTGSPTGGKVASATLTKGEGDAAVKYNHTSITLSGFNNGVVSFVVPRGTYKLNSVEASDSTHKGHWNGGADKVWPLGHLNDAEAGEVTLAELTAQTPNATVADQFTIYVAATLRQTRLTDSDNNHDTGDVSRTDVAVRTAHTAGTDETPSKDLIVFNYDPIDKVVTVTNTGNTTLKLKSVLTKKGLTAADTTFAAVTLTNGADTNGVTFKYTHTVAADGTETTLTTPEALTTDATGTGAEFTLQPGEARKVTIHITDKLENADDVTYRLDFTSVDGRPVEAPATPAKGPTVGYTLNIEIKPITIRRVTAEDVKGTFKVQHHWLMDDALNNNQPDTDATYSAGGEAHTWAAETLKEGGKKTLMDKLVKQGQTVDGVVATDDPTKSEIKYRWYLADYDSGKPTINTTTGELTFPNNKGHEVTANPDSNGTAYTPTEADHGKMLYLVAVGQRNATNAVMTPDEARFAETPVPIPYPATIRLFENKVNGTSGASERTQVSKDDGAKYEVWLWDTANDGEFPEKPGEAGSKAIKATATEETVDGKAYSKYVTEVILYPDHEYQVWTSAFRKTDDNTAAHYYRNTGFVIDNVSKKDNVEVDYYLVDVADTTLSQNDYEGKLGTIADDSTVFYNENDLTDTTMEAPTAKAPNKDGVANSVPVPNNYGLKNTDVTLGYPERTLDYDLNWTGGYTNGGNPDAPGAAVTHVVNYSAATAKIKTELKLKVYDVLAYVTGSLGSVREITMTMNDGVVDRVFSTAGGEGKIAGLKNGETVTSISTTDGSKTFRLPKYESYATVADYDDTAYTLQCYKYPHNGADKGKENFVVPVTADTSYDVVLQGEGFSMQVADDVDDQTQKNTNSATGVTVSGVYSDSADPKRQDGSQTQTIKFNYNYGADQKVKLTVTNISKQPQDETAPKNIIKNVTFTPDVTADNPIVVSTDAGDTNSFFASGAVASMDDDDAAYVTLKIPSGLDVGKYEYTAKFEFETPDDATKGASATYKLVVEVEPLTFNSVDVKKNDDGTLTVAPLDNETAPTAGGYTVTRKKTAEDDESASLLYRTVPAATDTDADATTALKQNPDYGYQWISAPVGMSYDDVKAAVSWSNGALTVTEAANGVKKGSGTDATQKVYTPKDADSGRNLFLVIYGKDDATGTRHNATSFAVSPAQVNTYKGMVALKVDDAEKRGKDDADSADTVNKPNDGDGYEVWFISKNDATVKKQATWTKVGTEYAYVADLTPNDNGYSVEISRAKDDSKKVTLTGATITGTNVKTTIDTTGSNVVEAPFFTVNALAFVNKEYQTGTGEDFTGVSITPTITIGTDHAELANNTPVLSGQTVAAKAPAMADDATKAWTQDYTLTWRQKSDDNDAGTGTTVTDTDLTDTTTKGQSATAAIADGAYAFGTVSAKTFIGGRLDQTTYEIVGTIHGPTGNTQQVKKVSLKETTSNVTYWNEGATDAGIKSGKWTDGNNDGQHNNGDQVTFTVVKGTYTVTGYEDTNFTIRKVTVEGTDAASTPRNEKTFTQSVEKLAEAKRVFDIYLEATGPKLTVNDKVTTTITATSELPDHNHQFADNNSGAHYYYKQLGSDGVFTLELSNPGNVDLKLKAPEVYKVKTGTDYSDSTKLQNALTAGTTSKVTITNGSGTDTVDTNRTILTFTGLPAADDDVLVGAKVSHGGTELANAGTITVSKDVYNKDDAIYVVKFASQYTTTDGSPAGDQAGPTVYYVLDLQVEPLPIKKVTAETDPTKTDGTLRLKDLDLDSVLVDDDLDDATDPVGAKTAGLVDADISYVWYSAPTDKTVNAADFQFNATSGALELSAAATGKDLQKGANAPTGNTSKTYTPTDAEQGLNFYLVAYRTDADKNASDFAVSDAVYAQVTIAMKAYRTGKADKSDTEATPLLTEVNISTMVGEDKKTSNADTVTVTGVADNANVLTFNATKTDVIAAGATDDDPAAAKWYFKSWAVKPLTGDELDATDTSIETPVGGERLTMNYTATGKATVIGYFDKLPELKEDKGYNVEAGVADNKADRTFHYEPNDGSGAGKVQIWIQPVNGNTWKNDNSAENKKPKQLTAALMIPPAAGAGAQGDYELTKTFLDNNLWQSDDSGDYRITFFDMERGAYSAITATNDGFEGTPREGGYAGYDRSVIYSITEGEKTVIAKVTNSGTEAAPVYWGQVKITNTALTDNENGPGDTATLATQGGSVRLFAIPKDGYAFAGWSKPDNEPNSKGKFGNTADAETPYTGVRQTTETVIATFRKGDFTPQADAKTSVYYGDDELQETDGKLVVSVTKDKDATQNFSYALATEAELTTYLNGAARPANAYTTDGVEVVPGDATKNTNKVPAWLEVNADATDNTKVNFTVKANTPATGVNVQKTTGEDGKLTDAEDELVVYLKVTEDNTEESKIVPVTIDVKTSQLKIRTAGTQADETTLDGKTQAEFDGAKYKDKFIAAYGPTAGANADPTKVDQDQNEILHGSAVEAVMFEFLKIDNEKNANDVFIDEAINPAVNTAEGDTDAKNGTFENKGKWSWNPLNHTGSGNSKPTNSNTYTFTFTYDTGKDEEKWNYEGESIEIKLPVLRPKRSLLIADKVKNYADVKTVLVPGGDDDYSTIKTAGETDAAPVELDYTTDTFRKNESITYLDTEPVYTAIFQRTGVITDIELTIEPEDGKETVGFEVPTQAQLDAIAASLTSTDDVKEATLDLTVTAVHDKVWVGEHYIRFHLTGKDDQGDDVDAYYTLSLTIDPRLITAVDVTTEYNKTEPTDVTPTIEGDPTLNDKGEDAKGNTPIKDATVTWETEDAKNPVPVKETVTVEIDPNYKIVPDDIKPETELNGKNDKDTPEETGKNPDPNTEVTPEAPAEDKTDGGKITITQLHPILMFNDQKEGDDNSKAGPAVNHVRHLTSVKVGSDPTALGKVLIDLGAYSSDVYDVDVEVKVNDFAANGGVLTPELPEGQLLWPQIGMIAKDGKTHYVMDLTGLDTSKAMAYVLRLEAKGTEKDGGAQTILATYELHLRVTPNSPPPSGGGEVCPCKVFYHVGLHGTTTDATVEDVSESNRPSKIPTVTALDGYAFRGWSLTNPATLKQGEKIELVDPKTVTVKGDAMTFYAVIVERPFHEHYVIGYPNGNFGPADNINRASVATIIARAILPDFVEGANYGNPGGYSDVSGHWAESAIAYCSKFDVFKGYTDGTFRPDQPITRQEFATVIARLDGELTAKDIPFDDIDEAGDWAMNGIYTSYEKGWVNGYTDGTFKPLNNIRRDEAVKVFNAYLNRGVDADGLADLHEYVHTGVASNNTENGVDEYMTWPDVPKGHWAYYEIVEAANDHEFTPDFDAELGYTLPEHWEKCWIDERWRYGDGPSGGDSAAMVSAGFQVWLH